MGVDTQEITERLAQIAGTASVSPTDVRALLAASAAVTMIGSKFGLNPQSEHEHERKGYAVAVAFENSFLRAVNGMGQDPNAVEA